MKLLDPWQSLFQARITIWGHWRTRYQFRPHHHTSRGARCVLCAKQCGRQQRTSSDSLLTNTVIIFSFNTEKCQDWKCWCGDRCKSDFSDRWREHVAISILLLAGKCLTRRISGTSALSLSSVTCFVKFIQKEFINLQKFGTCWKDGWCLVKTFFFFFSYDRSG